MYEVVAALAGALVSALLVHLLNRAKRRTEIRKLRAEIKKLDKETEYYKSQLEIRNNELCVFDNVAVLRNFIDSVADLFAYYIYLEWLQWQNWDNSPGSTQHFLSMRRKEVERLALNLGGIGSVESAGRLYLVGDILFSALSADFWNKTVDPLLIQSLSNPRGNYKLRDELCNAFRRAFNEAIQQPESTIRSSQRFEVMRKYGYSG